MTELKPRVLAEGEMLAEAPMPAGLTGERITADQIGEERAPE